MPASAIRTLWYIGPKRSSRGDVEVERSQGRAFLWPLRAPTNRQGSKGVLGGRGWARGVWREGGGEEGGGGCWSTRNDEGCEAPVPKVNHKHKNYVSKTNF